MRQQVYCIICGPLSALTVLIKRLCVALTHGSNERWYDGLLHAHDPNLGAGGAVVSGPPPLSTAVTFRRCRLAGTYPAPSSLRVAVCTGSTVGCLACLVALLGGLGGPGVPISV
jgi:hypothetical protein